MSAQIVPIGNAKQVADESERIVSILRRKQDEQLTTATLHEIRRLKRETAKRRAGIDGLLTNITAHLNRRPSDDPGLPSDSQGEGA